jgi:hypothetical protein
MIYCLIKIFGGLYRFNVLLNREMPFLFFIPFYEMVAKAYLTYKYTLLLLNKLNGINYLWYTPLLVKGEVSNLHMK